MIRAFFVIAAAVILALPAQAAGPTPDLLTTKYGETRAYFQSWLAVCKPGEDACRAVAYAGEVGHVGDYEFFVRSAMKGLDYQLVFVPVKVLGKPGAPITLTIGDWQGVFEADADDGWYVQAGDSINEYTFGQARANIDVLPEMKAGTGMYVRFTGEDDQTHNVRFSLMGLTDALAWMDAQR